MPEEADLILSHMSKLITQESGFETPSRQQHLEDAYNDGKHPGFDYTYECPSECANNEWCQILCDGEHTEVGHEKLTQMSNNLKASLHDHAKTGDLDSVKCLGIQDKLDLHLRVAVSPYIHPVA